MIYSSVNAEVLSLFYNIFLLFSLEYDLAFAQKVLFHSTISCLYYKLFYLKLSSLKTPYLFIVPDKCSFSTFVLILPGLRFLGLGEMLEIFASKHFSYNC